MEQATEIRRRLLYAFEYAENELDPEKQRDALTFVVVGGGPTGVELAGAIADISRTVMVADFRRIDSSKARVILVEAAPRVLGAFPEDLSAHAEDDLRALGVEVMTNSPVSEIDATGVRVGDAWIRSRAVFWAAGVQASPFELEPALALAAERPHAERVDPHVPVAEGALRLELLVAQVGEELRLVRLHHLQLIEPQHRTPP